MENQTLTPEESLKIIDKAISNFKSNYKESAAIFLLWGWILTFASFSHFFIIKIVHAKKAWEWMGTLSMANWGLFIFIGMILLIIMLRKMDKERKVYSYMNNYIKVVWSVAAVAFFVATFLCIKMDIMPPPIMLLIAGVATTISGLLLKFRPLYLGGMSFFIFSIATSFVTNEYVALLTGIAIFCGYIIPGYYLKSAKE